MPTDSNSWTVAFGRYLRILRERTGLSLDQVASLSQSFADTVNKGYVSRCENGRQRLAFSKVIPLSRVYQIPVDILVQRMELDLELERVGSPDLGARTFPELTSAGREALRRGRFWDGYAFLRAAHERSFLDPLEERFENREHQVLNATINCATGIRALRRYKLALFELEWVQGVGGLSVKEESLLIERLATVHSNLGNAVSARELADRAIELAQHSKDDSRIGYAHSRRAIQASDEEDIETAIQHFSEAYEALKRAGEDYSCASNLTNLAQLYFDSLREPAARRAAEASQRIAQRIGNEVIQVRNAILLGELEDRAHREAGAHRHWKEAIRIAKSINDKVLRFKAEYLMWALSRRQGNAAVARSIERRLRRLAPYVPDDVDELVDFRKHSEEGPKHAAS